MTLRSRDPQSEPAIRVNFLATEFDRAFALAGARLTRKLAGTSSLAPYVAQEIRPGPDLQSDDQMMEYVRDFGTTGFHPVGTCRMGADAGAVVDARLRVHGIRGLRVIDASVMPTIVSANTNAPPQEPIARDRGHLRTPCWYRKTWQVK